VDDFEAAAGNRCENCGIPYSSHGEECGYSRNDTWNNPEYGRPGGWVDPGTGRRLDYDPTSHPAPVCLDCKSGDLALTECHDLPNGRCWVYRCGREECRREHVYRLATRLHMLEHAEGDDTSFGGTPVSLDAAGDPLNGK